MRTLYQRKQQTNVLTFSPISHRLAVGGLIGAKKGRVDVWEVLNDNKPITLPSLSGPPWDIVFTADDSLVVMTPDRIALYSGPQFRDIEIIDQWDDTQVIPTMALSPDGQRLVLDTESTVRLIEAQPPFTEVWSRTPARESHLSSGQAFAPDGQKLAKASDTTVEIWDTTTGALSRTLEKPEHLTGNTLLWSPDARWICDIRHREMGVWDTNTGHLAHNYSTISEEWGIIRSTAFHPSSGYVAVATARRREIDGLVHIYNPTDWQKIQTYSWPAVGRAKAITFHPEGKLAAIGGDKPGVVIWEVDW